MRGHLDGNSLLARDAAPAAFDGEHWGRVWIGAVVIGAPEVALVALQSTDGRGALQQRLAEGEGIWWRLRRSTIFERGRVGNAGTATATAQWQCTNPKRRWPDRRSRNQTVRIEQTRDHEDGSSFFARSRVRHSRQLVCRRRCGAPTQATRCSESSGGSCKGRV